MRHEQRAQIIKPSAPLGTRDAEQRPVSVVLTCAGRGSRVAPHCRADGPATGLPTDPALSAVRMRGRLIVPAKALDAMADAAAVNRTVVDAANWVPAQVVRS